VGISSATGAVGFMPVGVVVPFAGSTSPAGWELCYGQAISRTTYAGLFATLGTQYGEGDGSTTFNVPDMRGHVAAGRDNMGGTTMGRLTSAGSGITGTVLGAAGGSQTHTLTSAEMPSHTHTQNAHAHDFVGKYGGSTTISSSLSAPGYSSDYGVGGGYVAGNTATNQNTGGGGAHNNMQPTIVLNYIIKF